MDAGELVPDEIVVGVIEECLAPGGPLGDGFVLDGFPRTLHQAEELDRVLDGTPLDLAIDLDVPREIVLDRIAGRRVCENCQRVYHVNMPPTVDWTCDTCGGQVVQRDDDTEEAIDRRLELYEEQTVPIIDYYRERGMLARSTASAKATTCSSGSSRSSTTGHCQRSGGSLDVVLRKTPDADRGRCAGRARSWPRCTRRARGPPSPGATTADLDAAAREVLDRRGARSNFLGYHGFPAVACISPNEVIVHGIPGDRVIEDGDIVSIDCGAIIEGWHADAAITVPVGAVDDESQRLIDATRASLDAAIAQAAPGNRLGDIGAAVEGVAAAAGFAVVREYVGHGIGTAMHEEPEVPNYGPAGRGAVREGMVLAHRADGQRRASAPPACSTTAGPS